MEKKANGWSAEETQQNFPHCRWQPCMRALTYYQDHLAECDAQIELSARIAAERRALTPEGPFVARMRSEGKIPRA